MSSADDNFLADISAEAIACDTPQGAIYAGHDVCVAIDDGADPVDLGMEITDETDLTTDQVATFVVSAVDNFCPSTACSSDKPLRRRGDPAVAAGSPRHPFR